MVRTMEKILIFIPMYNCEKQIPRVLERISQVDDYKNIFTEITMNSAFYM